MKKLFFISAIAVVTGLMTSCSNEDEITSSGSETGNSISFTANGARNLAMTRSGASITSLDEFFVSAVNADKSNYFDKEKFSFDNASAAYTSATPHYWPTTGSLSFFAVNELGTQTVNADGVPEYSYSDWAGENDLVAATVIAGEKQMPYPLTFRHLTSQIYISAEAQNKTEELTYKLIGVKMTTACDGKYSFDKATGGSGSWDVDGSSSKTYSYEDALPLSFAQSSDVAPKGVYWNILPNGDKGLSFNIEYQVLQNGKVIADFTGENSKHVAVKNTAIVSGKKYVFNFILPLGTSDMITFTSNMSDWEDENQQSENIDFLTAANSDPQKTWVLYKDGTYTSYDISGTITGYANYDNTKAISNTKNIESIIFGNKVTSIEECAFMSCENITSVSIPSSVKSIGHLAFGRSSITNLVLPEGLTTLGEGAFTESKVKTVSLPKTLTSVGRCSFQNCPELEEVVIHEGVTEIKPYAFCGDHELKAVYIPSTVTEIGEQVFYHCDNLNTLFVDKNNSTFYADETGLYSKDMTTLYYAVPTSNTTLVLPDNLTTISDGAFKGNKNLSSIKFPKSLKQIGDEAFEFCYGLTEISIPDNVKVGRMAFSNCVNVSTITIGSGCTLGTNCFAQNQMSAKPYNYSTLESVTINGKMTIAGYAVFYGCVNLNAIKYNSAEAPVLDEELIGNNNPWSSLTATYAVGYNNHTAGSNMFYVPSNATYSETEIEGANSTLFNTDKCGFTLSKSL